MTTVTEEQLKEALSIACEATREGDLQVLDEVAANLELCDDTVLQALRAALHYMLVLDSQREGWGVFHPAMEFGDKVYPVPLSRIDPPWFPIWARAFSCAPMRMYGRGSLTFFGKPNTGPESATSGHSEQ